MSGYTGRGLKECARLAHLNFTIVLLTAGAIMYRDQVAISKVKFSQMDYSKTGTDFCSQMKPGVYTVSYISTHRLSKCKQIQSI